MLAFTAAPLLWLIGLAPGDAPVPAIAGSAQAIVGMPLTPVSAAGVARRTTRRAVVYGGAAAAAAQPTTVVVEQPAAPAAPAPAAAPVPAAAPASSAAALTPGTVVSALPSGCTSLDVSGTSYFNCAGTTYKPVFQSSQLVYVVQ